MGAETGRRQAKDALFDGFATVAKALASGRRAEVVELLPQRERTGEQIADEIGQSVATTSFHLRTLARAGLVDGHRHGTHVRYRLASDAVLELWWAMRRVAAARLEGLDTLARDYLGDRDRIDTITREALARRLDRGDVVVVEAPFLSLQLDAVLGDFAVAATKTGMLATAELVSLVAARAEAGDLPASRVTARDRLVWAVYPAPEHSR